MYRGFSTLALRHFLVAVLVTYGVGDSPTYGAQATPGAVLPNWAAPADIDQAMPPAVTEIPCPLPQLLQGVSERVQELVQTYISSAPKNESNTLR